MHKGAVGYVIRVFAQRLLGMLLFGLGAKWVFTWQSWTYFGAVFAIAAVSLGAVYRSDPDTLAHRGKVVTDSPLWDKVLLGLYWPLDFFVIHLLAGFESRSGTQDCALFWLGMAFLLASAAVVLAALLVNTYLESTARIQEDRGQTVVTQGIYAIVRHPTYTAVLIGCVGKSLVFPGPIVWATAAVIAAIITVRTYLEDNMLKKDLPGYAEYAQKTKYRLVPYVW